MRRLVVSTYYEAGLSDGYSRELVRLWSDHLRGPGCFGGDILLFTNLPDLEIEGVTVAPVHRGVRSVAELCLARILDHEAVPADRYDSVVQMDLDMLALRDVGPLFATDERLWVAPSNLRFVDQAWPLLSRVERLRYRRRRRELGVSACLVSSSGTAWRRHLGRWARAIDEDRGRAETPPYYDQSYLNVLRLRREIPMRVYGRTQVQHRDWTEGPEALIFHFAGVQDRLDRMRQYSLL